MKTIPYETHEQWLDLRRQGIGGSDAAAILGHNPHRTPLDVYLDKRGESEPDDLSGNDAVWLGNILEEPLAKWAAQRLGIKIRRRNAILQHPDHEWMRASLDYEVVGESVILECKTSGLISGYLSDEWGEPGTDEVPAAYLIQGMHYLAITGKDRCIYPVVLSRHGRCLYHVDRDEEFIAAMIPKLAEFWRKKELGIPPPPTSLSDLKHLYPVDLGEIIQADSETAARCVSHVALKLALKELGEAKDVLELDIKTAMGNAAILEHGGRTIATWKSYEKSGFTVKPSTQRPLLIKK